MAFYEDDFCVPTSRGRQEAREWIGKNGARLHRGLAPPSGYDKQRAQIASNPQEPAIDVVQYHTDHFHAALAIYHSSNKGALKDLDVRKAHSWDEISREHQDAQMRYAEKGKGWLGLPRKLARSAGENADSIYPWLNFIPNGTYTTMLQQGLLLIFGAATRLSERRQLILETFGRVPFLVQYAEYSFEDFYNDQELKRLITELYLSILQAIMAMMEWLVEKAGWKQIKALLQGSGYECNLEDMVNRIQQQTSAIDSCVNRLTRGAIVSTASTTKKTDARVEKLECVAEMTKKDTREIKADTRDIIADTGEIKASVQDFGTKQDDMNRSNENAFSHIINVLDEQKRTSEWNQKGWQEAERRKEELEKSERLRQEMESKLQVANAQLERVHRQQGMIVRTEDLLRVLEVDPTQVLRDIDAAIRGGQTRNYAVQGRGHMLMQNSKFRDWLSSAQSKSLLVDGNAESSMERISAMSVVCALLSQSLPNETASTISYFCGMRTTQADGLAGPIHLVRNLLAQLIYTHKLDTSFVEAGAYCQFQHFDLRRLCIMLVELVRKLPYGAVLFCIVDGISWIEEEESLQEACFVVRTLSELTRDPEVRAVFKLLITSPLASRYVVEYIPFPDRLSLLREVAESDGSSLTQRHVMLQLPEGREEPFDEVIRDVDSDEGFVDGGFDEGTILDDD